ncbi:cupin domain-containing protein [Ammoniphilus sp. CFH 90114]|uniref:cupin domain-containing protein n=1 Tax=Ammoniphilus sp. CFH 90114 TaxID=2493665 RepID=UPI00100E34FF|nr:cupin domain-containing protein [Ammoniphilus sp. CFH 90114]RXT05820.1 cupin domain-containing protein [Ammoniphilus sp. CFH 90114]
MSSGSEVLLHISERIREIRTEKRITLKEMSEITGLSISFLSQVERGTSSLAITSLEKIALALDIPMSKFFMDLNNTQFVIRKVDQKELKVDFSSATLIRLAGEFPERKMDPLIMELQPAQNEKRFNQHSGEEFYYVLDGEVDFTIEEEVFHLKKGDAIHFPSHIPHLITNPLSTPSKLICVLTPCLL